MDSIISASACEFADESTDYKSDINKLRLENEKYRQELYEVRRKLEVSEALQKELEEANQSLEQALLGNSAKIEQKIQESEEKFRSEKKDYENRLANAETEIQEKSKEVDDLKDRITEMENVQAKMEKTQDEFTSLDDHLVSYKLEIEKLMTALQETEIKKNDLEDMVNDLNKQHLEFKEALEVTRNQLSEKNEQLECVHEELFSCRAELNAMKATPASTSSKGNSLFAEVEDRYQMILSKMNAVQNKYQEAKRLCQAREAENKALKAERAVMLKKWEHDAVDTMEESNDLISKYRNKINELQNTLKLEREKNNQEVHGVGDSFSYLQTLLVAKKKEVDKLQFKIENDAIKSLVQEDIKFQITKQLRYWRYKAMSMQAQIMALKSQLEGGLDAEAQKMISEVLENCTANIADFSSNFSDDSTFEYSAIMDEKKLSFGNVKQNLKHSTLNIHKSSKSMFEELGATKGDHQLLTMNINSRTEQRTESTKEPFNLLQDKPNQGISELNKTDKENYQRNSNMLPEYRRPNLSSLTNSILHESSNDKKLNKILRYAPDAKETQGNILKKQPKQVNYPILSISKNEISNISLK